jgi:hypothetical protein
MMAKILPRGVCMEWEEHFDNGVDMVAGAKARIEGEDKPIRYINGRYKLVDEEESRWLFNIAYQVDGDNLLIVEQEQDHEIRLPLNQVEYLKLRPFYFAACIGFKAFVFYNDQAC